MYRKLSGYAVALLLCAGAHGGTVSTNLTVNGSGTTSGENVSATGTVTLSGIGTGTLSSSFSLISAALSGSAPLTFTITSGSPTGTLTATITGSITLLAEIFAGTPNTSGPATITVTAGTGGFAGATGTFNVTAAGTGAGTTQSGGGTFSLTGSGTLNIPGSTGGGGTGGGPTPSVSQVQNNYSYILPGLPNYGIAPGSLFIVKGTNLATNTTPVLQSSGGSGLPTSLNGASISVTVAGVTTTPALYYTSTSQLAAVLPSTTPVGTGTITVTNTGQTSVSAPIVVVQSALGLDVATDANVNYFAQTASASPGQTIILWGSGVGADTSNNDKTYPLTQNNLTSIPMTVYIGGIAVAPLYRGRSQYPGVDQVNVVIPSNVPLGCSVSIVAVSGNIVSNSITIPVAQGGGTCSDPTSPTNPGLIQTLTGKSQVNFGYLAVEQATEQTASTGKTTSSLATAAFYGYPGSAYVASLGAASSVPSLGSCVIIGGGAGGITPTGLDAGTITVSGGGTPVTTLQGIPTEVGTSYAQIGAIPATGAAYTFSGSGGKNVGAFNTTLNFPQPLVWTNPPTSVTRSAGQVVNWTGGASGTFVSISGQSSITVSGSTVSATFICYAPVSAGTFTVPSWILLALPPTSNGGLSVSNETTPQSFSASGLDFAYAVGVALTDVSVAYQ